MASVNTEMLLEGLKETLDLDQIKAAIEEAKNEGFYFNPFHIGKDGKPVGFDVFVKDIGLAEEVIFAVIYAAEKLAYETGQVSLGKEKLDAIVKFFDDVIVLPFYLEWADAPLIRMIVTFLITQLNGLLGKDWVNKVPVPTLLK